MDHPGLPPVTAEQQADLDCLGVGLAMKDMTPRARSSPRAERIVRVYLNRLRESDGARDWKAQVPSAATMVYGWFMGQMQECAAGTETSRHVPRAPWASLRFTDDDLVQFRAEIQDGPEGYRAVIDCLNHCPVSIRYLQDIGDTPLGLFRRWDGDDLVYSIWAGGSAYRVRVWAVTSHGVSQVLDVASRGRPDFLSARDGESLVRTYEADGGAQPERIVTWRYRSGRFSRTEADTP